MAAATRYRTIVADPPWKYDEFGSSPTSTKANPRGDGIRKPQPLPYPSMDVEDIARLPVRALVASNARLFLWTTNRYLPAAFAVIKRWGFSYKQTLVWHKTGNPSPFGGSIAPNHSEFLIVATCGTGIRVKARWPTTVIAAPASNQYQHSAKPDVFLDMVEQVSPGPYLELFARRQRLGWDTWGDEALEHVSLPESQPA